MDLRIVNTCNNNCLYCLEQSYRTKDKYKDTNYIIEKLKNNSQEKIINFYWWNPLLHYDFIDIIRYSKSFWYKSIGVLTNTLWLNKDYLWNLISSGLTSIWFYFNSFDEKNHNIIVDWWITLHELISNISLIKDSQINYKAIIHINNQNIKRLYKDIIILNKKYNVNNFEFINYFPFDRPYDKYKDLLEYDYYDNKKYINLFFLSLIKLNINAKFIKFSKDFFGDFTNYYDYENWILNQIWEEDVDRLKLLTPFCYVEKRCNYCFIKDNCKFYG